MMTEAGIVNDFNSMSKHQAPKENFISEIKDALH